MTQSELALVAKVTPALLSTYETARKTPSLPNLGKILDALGADLAQLEEQLDRANDRDPARATGRPPAAPAVPGVDLLRFLGRQSLPPRLQQVFGEMVLGFQRVARHVCDTTLQDGPRRVE